MIRKVNRNYNPSQNFKINAIQMIRKVNFMVKSVILLEGNTKWSTFLLKIKASTGSLQNIDLLYSNYCHCKLHEQKKLNKNKQLLQEERVCKRKRLDTSGGSRQDKTRLCWVWCSFKSGETRKFVPQIVKSCSSHFSVTYHFYLLNVWRVSVQIKTITQVKPHQIHTYTKTTSLQIQLILLGSSWRLVC